MRLTGKNILIISPQPWKHIFVSKHHYAAVLGEKENNVFYLNPPSGSFSVELTGLKNVYSLFYTGFPKGFRFYPGWIKRFFLRAVIWRLQTITQRKFDLVWSFDNSVFSDFRAFGPDVYKIAHIVDLNQNFEFKRFAGTADLCLSSNRYIIEILQQHNPNVAFIQHGVYVPRNRTRLESPLPGDNRFKVCYAGNIDIQYFDWTLFIKIVMQNPEVDFILAGPSSNNGNLAGCLKNKNVHYLGVLAAGKLQSFYALADVLLVCYRADIYQKQLANPHKMMEYLESGRMICATFCKEYEHLVDAGLILMSPENALFPELLKDCLGNLEHWNSPMMRDRRKAYSSDFTYEKQVYKIESLIA